jgi:glutamate formiminotransferase
MNLLDFAVTPLWLVWDAVCDLAAEDGVHLAESELIGLAPQASFEAIADHAGLTDGPIDARLAVAADYIHLRDYSPMQQILERRLEAARESSGPTADARPGT